MNKKDIVKYEKDIEHFIEQMREAGVKDETINQVINDINEYQQKQYEEMLKGMFERFREIMKEKFGGQDE